MTISSVRAFLAGIAAAVTFAAAGCGSGSIDASPVAAAPTTWSTGVFEPASGYQNRCAAPRAGADILGDPFPDKPGSLAQELFFLRSWTNQTYLWNTEVADQNPATFVDRLAYFATLKTNASTTSGRPKDQFHFSIPTADYLAQVVSAPEAGYGAELRITAASPPREVRVLYTAAGSPAAELLSGTPKLARGARILTVDGVDLVNATASAQLDTINNGLFPRTAGETHTFTVRYTDNTQRTITLVSAGLVESPVNRTTVLTTATGKVGYMLLNTFSPYRSERSIIEAIAALRAQGVNDVVLDLRYNGGGLLAVASQLGYMVAGPARTAGHTFERLQFNAAAGARDPVTGEINRPTPFYNAGLGFSAAWGAPIPSLDLPRVYILSTSSTCSASESVINGLRGVDVNVVLIGGATCGKPYGFYPQDNCGQTYFSVQFKGVNDKAFGDYADGFSPANSSSTFAVKIPGCSVHDDLDHELGDASELMLAAALGHRANGTCPAPTGSSLALASITDAATAIETSGRPEAEQILRNIRDLRMPARPDPQ